MLKAEIHYTTFKITKKRKKKYLKALYFLNGYREKLVIIQVKQVANQRMTKDEN